MSTWSPETQIIALWDALFVALGLLCLYASFLGGSNSFAVAIAFCDKSEEIGWEPGRIAGLD
jgi:hypothetical protein